MAVRTIVDLDSTDTHSPLFLFRDEDRVYLVNEEAYNRFFATDSSIDRKQLADIVIDLSAFDNHRIVKSRHF